MKLGDFFRTAATSRPVNPKSVKFTISADGPILPGNVKNESGGRVAATATAAIVFLSSEEIAQARIEARRAVIERCTADEKRAVAPSEDDYQLELMFQTLQRFLREWEPDDARAGDAFFPSVDNARKFLVVREANRLMRLYNEYVAEEHPEVIDTETFRPAKD